MSQNCLEKLPCYDRTKSYAWNYEHPPPPVEMAIEPFSGDWSFCGRPVASPLGIPAGPLLNGAWVLYYASLGFDVLTYKTVRSNARECYPLPNLEPVRVSGMLRGGETAIPASAAMQGSWAVSFGMPSKDPAIWREDVERTRKQLSPEKILSVSVVGSVQPGWSIDDLAADYARCARWAAESGADCVETNFSCPNVNTCDGQLYRQPDAARSIAQAVRQAIGKLPYLVKIGHISQESEIANLIEALHDQVDGLAMTNSVASTVVGRDGQFLFDGSPRGICGASILEASVVQVERFARIIADRKLDLEIVGVGGAASLPDIRRYLAAGAKSVHLATAAMTDPLAAVKIREQMVTADQAPA